MGDAGSCIGGNSLWKSDNGAGIFPGCLEGALCLRACLFARLFAR